MADVGGDRGQLLLVTALGIAVLLVTLALVVNTVIYTENLATRSSKVAGGSEAVSYRDAARDGLSDVLTEVNYQHNGSHSILQSNLEDDTGNWSSSTARLYAGTGASATVSVDSTVDGTRIRQEDPDRNFTNSSLDATDWTVVSDVSHTRRFRINVTKTMALEPDGSGDEFEVNVIDGANQWRLNVTHDASGTQVGVRNATGGGVTCSASNPEPWINVTAGTVAGDECEGLHFAEGLTTPYEIRFENGDNINGTYELIVDNDSLATNPDTNHHVNDDDPGAGSPYVTPAIYSTRIDLRYQTPRLYFNTTFRVAPGEPDG